MATSFADGTKISYEMAIVANATGVRVGRRGAYGPQAEGFVGNAMSLFPMEQMLDGGIIDYVVGAEPAPGVFIYGTHDHPTQQAFLDLYKLGEGPLYCFYRPYHLCHFEVPSTLARVALFEDPTITPIGPPVVDVITAAKRDLKAGEVLDGIGFYMTYGLAENADVAARSACCRWGWRRAAGSSATSPRTRSSPTRTSPSPPGRLADRLRAEQDARFALV
jgi:predicted homoserine dehydrogenase-like protein